MRHWLAITLLASTLATTAMANTKANTQTPSIEEHWKIARDHFEKRAYLEGAEQLQLLVNDHPTHWEARPIGAWFFWEASKRLAGHERSVLEKRAEAFILTGLVGNERSWFYNRELGDFYRLRAGSNAKAYPYYKQAVDNFESASKVQKAALLDRLARSAEELGRKGDAVTASCRALEFDPDDKMAKARLNNLTGNCKRKGINLDLEGESEVDPKNPKTPEESSRSD